MISDTLHDAVTEIDDYLADPVYAEAYDGAWRERILAVLAEMDALRVALDAR